MLRQTKIKEENKTELQQIRETLGYSRSAFSEKVIHKSVPMLIFYEKGYKVPDNVMAIARIWLDFYKKQNTSTKEE